jgi:hypothetical protein
MTSYQIDIKQCPKCGCEFTAWEVASCNTFGAKFYTDGCVKGPMFDRGSPLLICPGCSKYFWREDVPTLESMRDSKYFIKYVADSDKRSHRQAPWVQGHHYEDMVRQSFWRTPDEEKYIRIRAWWSSNSAYRDGSSQEFLLSTEQEDNLRRLLQLLDPNDPHDLIMTAEILRELGEFDECLTQLAEPFGERYQRTIDAIKKLAHDKKRQVELIG